MLYQIGKNERTAVYNVSRHILFLLHIIIIKITKVMTKTTELHCVQKKTPTFLFLHNS